MTNTMNRPVRIEMVYSHDGVIARAYRGNACLPSDCFALSTAIGPDHPATYRAALAALRANVR